MKTIKTILLLTAIAILSFIALGCSPEETEDLTQENCECTRTNFEVTFEIINSQTFWYTEELDSFIVPCQDEVNQFYYYDVDGVRRYYNIVCNNQRQIETIWTTLCNGNGFWVTKSNHGTYKINGVYCTQQEANDKCKEING